MTKTIRAHFDGKVIVPDEPVDLPVDQPLEVELKLPAAGDEPVASPEVIEERKEKAGRGFGPHHGAFDTLEALRRENLNEERW